MAKEVTQEMFLKDVAAHEMKVLLDQGNHRHLRFQAPRTSNQYFEIVTFPGTLVYVGDMGSFIFQRITDMFEFFRTKSKTNLEINPGYWSEKLEAVDNRTHNPGAMQYSEDVFRARVNEHVDEWINEFEGDYDSSEKEIAAQREVFASRLRFEIESYVFYRADEGEQAAHEALRNFSFEFDGQKYEFSDTWEWRLREYTGRFLWCCYALVWAINKYDEVH